MLIQVTKDVRVRAETDNNYVIEKRSTVLTGPKAGEDRWGVLGYYGRLVDAMDALLNRHAGALIDSVRGVPSARLNLKLGQVVEAINEARAAVVAAAKEIQ
jgi:hypothetical protein